MFALFAAALLAAGSVATKPVEEKPYLRVMPASRTPESSTIVLTIAVPKSGTLLNGNPVWIQFRLDGFSLGTDSQFDRASEISNSKLGQTVHVVIDDQPYFPIYEGELAPFEGEGNYFYNMSYKFEVPFRLKEGLHTVRVFPARSFGESLKGENTFHSSYFYIGSEKDNLGVDLSQPYLTYNEPSNQMNLQADKPVLLDFLINNCELSADGYKVRFSVDGKNIRNLTSWQPYYIYGLKKGRHTIRLELLDENNKLVPGLFNDVKQSITVH